MIYRLNWFGTRIGEDFAFKANVPGNIQRDYAEAKNWGDINYGKNCLRYQEIEDDTWIYTAEYIYSPSEEQIYFISGGIDYQYDILVNGKTICSAEGCFTPLELDITTCLEVGCNKIEVKIYPHPKRADAPYGRSEADHSVKPPVSYGWDWHPRVIPSGIWNDAYLETRSAAQPAVSTPTYSLSDDFSKAYVHFDVKNASAFTVTLTAPDGMVTAYSSADFVVEDPQLWWCNGEGEPNLYHWKFESRGFVKEGRFGFRRIELVMNEGAWSEPIGFPKSRSNPPASIHLNGRRIFAKGSNWVSPEIFPGISCRESYEPLVRLAKEAHMNIFRCWGGSGVQKDTFFALCDEMGIMVWQEFPLACNNYPDDLHYLQVLEKEARSIVRNLRHHPCVILWCGGNELLNSWSRMTDQSLALRLLNKVCYEEDPHTPFIQTSPLTGMGHGGYTFIGEDGHGNKAEVYQVYNNAHCTAYTEFGSPGIADAEYLKTFIPEEELFPPEEGGTSYELHHGFNSWHKETWLCLETWKHYFGEPQSLEDMCGKSAILQCAGYQAIFEEARRQQPYCSMVINWCYNEPWKTVANNAILSYPAVPKKAYYAVKESLRPVMPSARLSQFSYSSGDELRAELWLLNDTQGAVSDTISAYLEINGEQLPILDWNTPLSEKNGNIKGHTISVILPEVKEATFFKLVLVSRKYGNSEYTLYCRPKLQKKRPAVAQLNA